MWRQWFVAITNISEPVLNFVWPLEFCYHHQMSNPEVCLRTRWQKKYPKMVFSHSTLTSGLKLKNISTTPSMPLTHMRNAYILNTNFLKKKILDKKIFTICQIRQNLLPPRFCIVRYKLGLMLSLEK